MDYRKFQQSELDSAALYLGVSKLAKSEGDRQTLRRMAGEEGRHAETFARFSDDKASLRPNRLLVWIHLLLARILGYTFILKLLEAGEERGIAAYRKEIAAEPGLADVLADEEKHESEIMAMLDEERLRYVGDMVLGMNDALVELAGSLAGYTLAMHNTRVIAAAGLITGIAATLSMMASSYFSSDASDSGHAGKSALYTGGAYIVTVALLIIPYLLLPASAYFAALFIMLGISVAIIAAFNFYISVAKGKPFRRSFFTMAAISLGVAAVAFVVGLVVKQALGVNI